MGKTKSNIIEINGKRYDAGSGQPIDGVSHHVVKPQHSSATTVTKPTTQSIPVHHASPAPPRPKAAVHDAIRYAKAAKRHSPQHSKTLSRQAVKKPHDNLKRHLKAHGSTDHLAKQPSAHIAPKRSVHHVDSKRLDHARQVPKSERVKKFSKSRPASIAVPVAVKRITPAKPHVAHHTPSQATPRHKAPADDLLERAIRHATSHEQRPPKHIARRRRVSRRATSLAAVSIVVVVLGGFLAYSNLTNMQLKVASTKAGFAANLPEQAPAGYHLSHLNSSPGVVALNYHSNSDARSFAITEKASAWDSGTLRDTYLASSGQEYQTVESGGRTLYLLGQNAATWVSGGVWYQVHTNGSLSSRQLVTLATSL